MLLQDGPSCKTSSHAAKLAFGVAPFQLFVVCVWQVHHPVIQACRLPAVSNSSYVRVHESFLLSKKGKMCVLVESSLLSHRPDDLVWSESVHLCKRNKASG